ncbi:hypothetical protein BZA70DRAFT_184683 [Myxozyma melibiosi]|uniref:ER membrane protein complex subunit 7 beta-sandwich domain-containing protein n=1 Tax=Myxozyma melibiosi TaxID=54550 RepID=A0ABR1F4M3_9ASCO
MHLQSLILLAAAAAQTVSAYTVRGFLDPTPPSSSSQILPKLSYAPSIEITLRSSTAYHKTFLQSAPVSASSSDAEQLSGFAFVNVSEGSYQLRVNCIEHIFPVLRVDVGENEVEVFLTHPGNDWTVTGARQPYPVELKPVGKAVYYQVREGFNVLKLFKNPMLIISLFTLVMVFVLPKMMENMDPEQLKELQEQQSKSVPPTLTNPMNFDMASYLAGKSSSSSSGESAAGASSSSASGSESAKGQARSRKH